MSLGHHGLQDTRCVKLERLWLTHDFELFWICTHLLHQRLGDLDVDQFEGILLRRKLGRRDRCCDCLMTPNQITGKRLGRVLALPRLLDPNHHRVRSHEVLDAGFLEANFFHPAHAVGTGVVEASIGFDQHVQTHEEAEGVL